MIAPLLIHANPSKPFVLEMDAFDFALSVVLSQLGVDNLLHPIGFRFHKFSLVKINYEFHDKELLAIVDPFTSGVIYLKDLNMKSLCILIPKIFYIHNGSCVESMSSSMGIILVSIWVHDYLSSKMTMREIRCVISSLVPCA
jgi:hypothetical protein